MNNDDIVLRIKNLISYFDLNITSFSKKVDIAQSNLSAILNNKRPAGISIVNKIAIGLNVSREWLIEGKGEMLSNNSIINDAIRISDFQFMNIPFVSIPAQGGYGKGFGDVEYIESLPTLPVIVDKNYKGKRGL